MKKQISLLVLMVIQLRAMAPDDLDKPALMQSMSQPDEFEESEGEKYVRKFNSEYLGFLNHIHRRVNEIEVELKNSLENKDSVSSWTNALWTVTKSFAHTGLSVLKNPQSEDVAQSLSHKIWIIKDFSENQEWPSLMPQEGTQQLLEIVQGKISSLIEKYKNSDSKSIIVQLDYLREYDSRINFLENEFNEAFGNRWQNVPWMNECNDNC